MTSMRKLRQRLLRWDRYAASYGLPTSADAEREYARLSLQGHRRAYLAVKNEDERRFWAETPEVWLGGPAGEAALIRDVLGTCDVCGLPDLHHGQGDGIGSCNCPRCDCGVARSSYLCSCDPACPYCFSKTCDGDCDEAAYADEGDPWPAGVVTEHAFAEQGLL